MTSATLSRRRSTGRPLVRTFERGQSGRPTSAASTEEGAAKIRTHTAAAVVRGTLTVAQAAEIWAMLGIIPAGE